MIHHVLTNVSLPEQVRSLLGEECQVYVWRPDDPALRPILGTIEGIYAYGHMSVDETLIGRLPKLQVISNIGAGVDHIDLNAARRRGVPVGNTPDPLAGAVADMTFALILATAPTWSPAPTMPAARLSPIMTLISWWETMSMAQLWASSASAMSGVRSRAGHQAST